MKYILLFFCLFNALVGIAQYKKVKANTWEGIASYYSNTFNGKKTASGAIFSNAKLTAANNFLKLGTKVKVINIRNNKSVIVIINDRMNVRNKRLIDLSQKAAQTLGFKNSGLQKVRIEKIE